MISILVLGFGSYQDTVADYLIFLCVFLQFQLLLSLFVVLFFNG